jgi:hypothetical protein
MLRTRFRLWLATTAGILLTACGGNSSGAGNSAGSAGTDATGGNAGRATAGAHTCSLKASNRKKAASMV